MAYAHGPAGALWYELEGAGDVVVLSGGWGLAHHQFERVTPFLAADFQVLNWNWRGVGGSDRTLTAPHSIEAWTDDLEAVLDHVGIERAYFWGTSSGGMVDFRLAARQPERVAGIATWVQLKTDLAFRRAFELLPQIADTFGYDGFANLLCWLGLGSEALLTPAGSELARWERLALGATLDELAIASVCHAVAHADVRADAARVSAPVTVLAGTEGSLGLHGDYGAPALAELLQVVPHATVTPVTGASGTYFVLEKPEESAQAFTAWVRALGE